MQVACRGRCKNQQLTTLSVTVYWPQASKAFCASCVINRRCSSPCKPSRTPLA